MSSKLTFKIYVVKLLQQMPFCKKTICINISLQSAFWIIQMCHMMDRKH